jgi:hypothetical protein
MNTMTITRVSSSDGLSDDIKRDAAKGPVVTPDGFIVMRREHIPPFADEIDDFDRQLAAEAMNRDKDFQEGPSLDDVRKEYGL